MAKRVLMTGSEGFIGSVMAPFLADAGYQVTGLDVGFFSTCTLVPPRNGIPVLCKDIRDLEPADFDGYDFLIHLAAMSNDPLSNFNPRLTREINCDATVRLGELARAGGIQRFIFSSSCIMYGMSEARVVNEDSPLHPQTAYAASKVAAEKALSGLATDTFSPVFMRNGTIYGLSPRMRFDTVLNNLAGAAVATGKVTLHGDGSPWRPVVHVKDVARAFLAVLETPRRRVHNQAFNTGAEHVNCTIRELADSVAAAVPGCRVETLGSRDADQRTYKADFSKIGAALPGLEFEVTVGEGALELCKALEGIGLTRQAFLSARFTRLSWLKGLTEEGALDGDLRWHQTARAAAGGQG